MVADGKYRILGSGSEGFVDETAEEDIGCRHWYYNYVGRIPPDLRPCNIISTPATNQGIDMAQLSGLRKGVCDYADFLNIAI